MGRRLAAASVAALAVLLAAACSSGGAGAGAGEGDAAALAATPSTDCPPDDGLYDGLRAYLAEHAADEPWIDRIAVCAGGTIEVEPAGGEDALVEDALAVCEVAAGYLLTNPPPPERADAPNPRELGVIVADSHGDPVVLGAEDEAAAGRAEADQEEAAREEAAREEAAREEARREAEAGDGDAVDAAPGARGREREAEPHRCFAPFA